MSIPNLTANPETEPEQFLQQIVEFLGECYPVVQLFIQIDGTEQFKALCGGTGNVLARVKQIELWLQVAAEGKCSQEA
jgi:hypothetical protein